MAKQAVLKRKAIARSPLRQALKCRRTFKKEVRAATPAGPGPKSLLADVKDPRTFGVNVKVLHEYEAAMGKLVQKGTMPGCASVIFRRGEVIHTGCWGYADIEAKHKFTFDSICRLYCMTKSYIVVAFMTMMEEGLVDLDDRLDKYLPAFANMRVQVSADAKPVKPNKPILMKHVLGHKSGIDYAPDIGQEAETASQKSYQGLVEGVLKGNIRSLKSLVDHVAKCPLSCHPGEGYYYGFSMDVVARVLEVITGKGLEQILQERVFDPLGMKDTTWGVPDRDLHRLAAHYGSARTWGILYGDRKGKVPTTSKNGLCRLDGESAKDSKWRKGQHCSVLSGGGFINYAVGGLVGTVRDTAAFVHMLTHRGVTLSGQRMLHEKTFDLLERKQLKKSWGNGQACYLGNTGVFREGGAEVGMGGAACTYWSVDRKDDVATVWFTQNVDFPELDAEGMPPKADLWKTMHEAVKTAPKKRKSTPSKAGPAKQRRSSSKA